MSTPSSFPHPAYVRRVLEPNFEQAKTYLVPAILAASRAHALMLMRQGIIPRETGGRLLAGLAALEAQEWNALVYDRHSEDLFFILQHLLARHAGNEAVGSLQIARSRNDLDGMICRWVVRERLLTVLEGVNTLRHRLLALARTHLDTIMPAYTHTQPAQPTTLAHYLSAVLAFLERDAARLQAAYGRLNHCPLGAVALTTTGFPIDRTYLAHLLGFDAPVENSYDAVGGADYQAEVASVMQVAAASLSRFVTDLIFWATQEARALRIGGEFLQISSAMPQKQNPVVLEHIRTQLGYVYADAQGIFTLHHNTPLGDVNDVEDPLFRPLFRLLDYAVGIFELLEAVLTTAVWNVAHLADRAAQGYTTATELADTLVRKAGLTYHQAHQVVSRVVQESINAGREPHEIRAIHLDAAASAILGRPIRLPDEVVRDALDPSHFIAIRSILGGPAPAAMTALLDTQGAQLAHDEAWRGDRRASLDRAQDRLNQEIRATLATYTAKK